ncbi:MAG TPA: hypothetical protein VH439_06105 [Gemmatimonadales bacterium]
MHRWSDSTAHNAVEASMRGSRGSGLPGWDAPAVALFGAVVGDPPEAAHVVLGPFPGRRRAAGGDTVPA